MIADVLPRYYELHPEPSYTVLRSVVIDGHETVWMEYAGNVTFDITGGGREGEPYTGRAVYCECYFTEDVGWYVGDGKHNYVTDAPRRCLYCQAALHLRQLELRREYVQSFKQQPWPASELTSNIDAIILDLMSKAKAGEWVGEDGQGAGFWGGYFYLQTVAKIADIPMELVWKAADKLIAAKQIRLEGAVVQEYREPHPPGEDGLGNYMPIPHDSPDGIVERGFRIKAWQPRNSDAARVMLLRAWPEGAEDGEPAASVEVPMEHENMFGLDTEDMAALERATDKLLDELRTRP